MNSHMIYITNSALIHKSIYVGDDSHEEFDVMIYFSGNIYATSINDMSDYAIEFTEMKLWGSNRLGGMKMHHLGCNRETGSHDVFEVILKRICNHDDFKICMSDGSCHELNKRELTLLKIHHMSGEKP